MTKTDADAPPQQKSEPRGPEVKASGMSQLRRWAVLLPPLAGIALCVPLWMATTQWPTGGSEGGPGPAFFPRLLIALFALSMVVRIVQDIRTVRRGEPVGQEEEDDEALPEEGAELEASLLSPRRVAIVIALSVAYVVGTIYLGWVIATFLVVIAFLVLAGKRNLLIVVPLAAVVSIGFAYMFVKVVYLSLPTGVGIFDEFSIRLFELIGAY